ncbi:MAG: transposase [Phycisphaerae bacterium]|nr:transposase [Phycisphaerae bacterium]
MNSSTRSRRTSQRARRIRRRPRTRTIRRHQDQPLLWPDDKHPGPVFRNRQVRLKTQQRGKVTPYGGLTLAHDQAMRLGIDRDINRSIHLLKLHMPYRESDHILTHVYNLYVGGQCIEDIANLQHSQAVKHLVGACRIPDPTTAGDFLRRFEEPDLHAFQGVIDRAREKVWRKLPRRRKQTATVDMDSTIKEVYGHCKQGADFGLGGRTYRVVVKRQEVDVSEGQEYLFTQDRQRFVITNIPRSEMNAGDVVSFAYGRCDQENIIEQLKNGIAAMRMPTGELLANGAFLMAGQLAWCLRSWLSLLALPTETLRWEWKWFRQAFVYVAAKITQTGRRCVAYLADGHRFTEHLLIASQRLQSFTFD